MAKKNKATAEQRQAIAALADELGREAFAATFNKVTGKFGARAIAADETATQAAKRLSSSTADALIAALAPVEETPPTPVETFEIEIPWACREAREYAKAVWSARWVADRKVWTVESADAVADITAAIDDEVDTAGVSTEIRYEAPTSEDLDRQRQLKQMRDARYA